MSADLTSIPATQIAGAHTGPLTAVQVIRRLLRDVAPARSRMLLSIAAGIAGHCAAIALMVCGAGAIAAAAGLIAGSPASWIAVVITCAVLRGLLHYVEQLCGHDIAFHTLALIREKVFTALRHISPGGLVRTRRGDISATVMADVEAIEVFYAHTVAPTAIALVVCTATVVGLAFASPAIAVVQVLAYAAVVLLPGTVTRRTRTAQARYRAQFGAATAHLLESVRGMRDLVLLGAQEATISSLADDADEIERLAVQARMRSSVAAAIPAVAIAVTGASALVIGSAAGLSPAAVLLATVAAVSSFGPVTAIGQLAVNLSGTLTAARRVFTLEDSAPAVSYGDAAAPARPWRKHAIAFDAVGFRYPDACEPVLADFDLSIAEGERVVLAGPSGAGKSTLLRLLLRYFDPDKGRILIDGVPVTQLSEDALRSTIVLVTQETFLFDDTVAANIRLAQPDADDTAVATALERARAAEFVAALPHGAETRIGELGGSLSGGERQRLGLARALLSKAPIVVLDEPTSNLDEVNQRAVLEVLRTEFTDRTLLMVSHRDAAIDWADRVIRLDAVEQRPRTH